MSDRLFFALPFVFSVVFHSWHASRAFPLNFSLHFRFFSSSFVSIPLFHRLKQRFISSLSIFISFKLLLLSISPKLSLRVSSLDYGGLVFLTFFLLLSHRTRADRNNGVLGGSSRDSVQVFWPPLLLLLTLRGGKGRGCRRRDHARQRGNRRETSGAFAA